ncbi:MBL fold metallo-hydrolase [Culicoidibacter larvae]|uniref:MBL fold metallo-hydrolase n=1 Tax=Culicoidibacter larvae TaxID=2579976 RepID=A0A5R8QFK3_9FIRM|nr:MBL fold metallo-hydrolase [Culicoidibacter larvae]TLG76516.1 MBL fold metallo-hydrolase [Culicoidibacter larvae]
MNKVKCFICGDAQENTYILSKQNKALIIDPGAQHPSIVDYIENNHLQVEAILLTHCHFDHIAAVDFFTKKYKVPVYIHELDQPGLVNPKQNLSVLTKRVFIVESESIALLKKKGSFSIGDFTIDYLLTPGHSLGSVTFIIENAIFSGDVLFEDGVGRYDFPFCSVVDLGKSLEKLFALDDHLSVYPGHGGQTTIGREKAYNTIAQSVISYAYSK